MNVTKKETGVFTELGNGDVFSFGSQPKTDLGISFLLIAQSSILFPSEKLTEKDSCWLDAQCLFYFFKNCKKASLILVLSFHPGLS